MCRLSLNAVLALDAEGASCLPPWHRVLALRERHCAAEPPAILPLAEFDFAGGAYAAGGTPRALADMFQVLDNGFWTPAAQPDPGDISAAGWAGQAGEAGTLLLSEPAKTGWWDGTTHAFVAVLEFDYELAGTTEDDRYYPLMVMQPAEGPSFDYLETGYFGYCGFGGKRSGDEAFGSAEAWVYVYDYSDSSATDEAVGTDLAATPSAKIAARFTADEIALCTDGGSIFTAAVSRGEFYPLFDLPYLSNLAQGDASGNLRRIAFYPADADMQALTAA